MTQNLKSKLKHLIGFISTFPLGICFFKLLLFFIRPNKAKKVLYVYTQFEKFLQMPDFKIKYDALISGLDVKSVYDIEMNLKLVKAMAHRDKFYFFYFDKESFEFLRLENKLADNIIKINDDKFIYNNFKLPINAFSPEVFCFQKGIQFLNNLDYIKNKNILDIGAFIGDSALLFSQYTDKKVYSFEPLQDNYIYLTQTISLNNLTDKIIPEKIALSSHKGTDKIVATKEGTIAAKLSSVDRDPLSHNDISEVIKIDTLDNYCMLNNIDSIGLISIDIEGAEQLFLNGAINSIKKFKPILLISIYHNPDDFFNIKPMIESWQLGYHFTIRRYPSACLVDTVLICQF
jgi:FkbM family methyltransferase